MPKISSRAAEINPRLYMRKPSIKNKGVPAVAVQRMVRRDDRYVWIMAWIKKNGSTDVLNSDFVDAYIEATSAKFRHTAWGAYKCPTLGKDLAHMARCGALKRGRIGLGSNWQPGFPKWVWAYSVGHAAYLYTPNAPHKPHAKNQ